jgi:hypothetical protein
MLLEDLLPVYQNGEAWRAFVFDFGADSSEALIGGEQFTICGEDIADIHLVATVKKNLLINWIDLLGIQGSGGINRDN